MRGGAIYVQAPAGSSSHFDMVRVVSVKYPYWYSKPLRVPLPILTYSWVEPHPMIIPFQAPAGSSSHFDKRTSMPTVTIYLDFKPLRVPLPILTGVGTYEFDLVP